MVGDMGNGKYGLQNQEGVSDHLRKQLAVAVRSVQWSYAIFWSLSTKQQGALEWGDGYYNGDIKTRKTVSEIELKPDKMGLQRSEQLRELYGCLLEGEDQQAKKPAALSPDDLSDTEWYYLVCMSFVFNYGQGLPGRALANNKTVWLQDAPSADSKVFSRSLLAKSASIQTVVCFPYLGGVIELGVTDLVIEDPSLIQHIKASLLEFLKPVCSERSSSARNKRDGDADLMHIKVDNEEIAAVTLENFDSETETLGFDENQLNELEQNFHEEFSIGFQGDCSNGCENKNLIEDSFIHEGTICGVSQVESWHSIDVNLNNCIQNSMNSSDCISQALANQEKAIHGPKTENTNAKLSSLELEIDEDLHYQKIISAILTRNSHGLLDSLYPQSNNYKSSFVRWTKAETFERNKSFISQEVLKQILLKVPLMYEVGFAKSEENYYRDDRVVKFDNGELLVEYGFPDKKMENEKFLLLSSMVPTVRKIDKESILDDTIDYLKELEARVEELESCIDISEHQKKGPKRYQNLNEKTSVKYGSGSSKMPLGSKRKASDIDESSDPELSSVVPEDGSLMEMKLTIKEPEVSIQIRCSWRENILLDIIDAVNNLNMDAHSVQSSTIDGILTLTLESKFRGAAVASATMIRHKLSAIARNC